MKIISFILLVFLGFININAQNGISVSPPRVYFESDNGVSKTQTITVANISNTLPLDIAISLGDWEYNENGDNIILAANTSPSSCASWINVKKEDSYFTLAPSEKRDIDITITSPNILNNNKAHSAILYVSQMNPYDDVDSNGANIKLSMKSGIKIFHKTTKPSVRKIDINNLEFNPKKKTLILTMENQSDNWIDGKVITEIINNKTGKKISFKPIIFYTMPGNIRILEIPLDENLSKGSYSASVLIDTDEKDNLEMGELNFDYE